MAAAPEWRKMTAAELKTAVPERAPVIRENIETELRTASGITDGKGRAIFGVVIITAGYEANGKYTHFFKTQTKIKFDTVELAAGEYVFGYQRQDSDTLNVTFYNAKDGTQVGSVQAKAERKRGAVYSFYIDPPSGNKGSIRIGRFAFAYSLE